MKESNERANWAEIANCIDHTYLKREGDDQEQKQLEKLCYEAKKWGAFSVCVRPNRVRMVSDLLQGSKVKITTVLGFPAGDLELPKKEELKNSPLAHEFDMVLDYKRFLAGKTQEVFDEVRELSDLAQDQGKDKVLKVILETTFYSEKQKREALEALARCFESAEGLRFFKTSTGFAQNPGKAIGATLEDMKIFKDYAGDTIGIKPAGGIKSWEDALNFCQAAGLSSFDPLRFRLGSSSLLNILFEEKVTEASY